jgi:hypothetical protein
MSQTSGTTTAAPAAAPDGAQVAGAGAGTTDASATSPPGFGPRGRVRRRARFLRKARELAYRDLGGLVFNLHRFGQRNDALVLAKLNTLGHIDAELRTLESALSARDTVTVLREAGITACPRCAAIHGGEDRFCPNCGLSMSRHVDLPIAGAPVTAAAPPAAAAAPAAVTPAAPAPTAVAPGASAPAAPAPKAAASAPAAAGPTTATASPAPVTAAASPAQATPAGRSPTPPSRPAARSEGTESGPASAEAPTSADGPAAPPVEEEQTEILHPLESDK